jgi:AcrR family transcriptional regulator
MNLCLVLAMGRAGVSNSALYAHFPSKAELLVDAVRTHGRRRLSLVAARRNALEDGEWDALLGRIVTALGTEQT